MTKFRLIVAALALVLSVSVALSSGYAEDKVYINGFDAAYPPFTFIGKDGKPAGFDIDSINWIAKEMGFQVKHQPTDWAAIVPSLKAKKIDLIASGMSITPERQAAVDFCDPYWQVVQLLVVRKDSNLTVEEALQPGRKIGLLRGSAESKWMTENQLKKGYKYELKFYDTTPLAIEDVANGRADAAAVSNTALQEALDRGAPVKGIGRYGQPDVNYGYAVRKEDDALQKTLNEGLARLKASPYWDELVKKWFTEKK
jgi:polar amino acid transport system substrate-binding protein